MLLLPKHWSIFLNFGNKQAWRKLSLRPLLGTGMEFEVASSGQKQSFISCDDNVASWMVVALFISRNIAAWLHAVPTSSALVAVN